MPTGELFINGKDAYREWGVSMDTNSLSVLMTPAPVKPLIENSSRLENGKRVITKDIKQDERSITLSLNITAKSESEFFDRYNRFCGELAGGVLNIKTAYQPDITYRTIYLSCSQFSQFMRGIGKFSLKLSEPNPTVRVASGGDAPGGGEENPGVDLTNKLDKTGDGKDVFVTFTQAGERKNISSKETLSLLFGKIKKWFGDLKAVAFSGKASDLTEDETHRFVTDSEKIQWNNSSFKFQPNGVIDINTSSQTISMPASVVIKNNVAYSYETQSITYSEGEALKEVYHNGTTWAVRNFSQENIAPVAFYFRSDLQKVWGLPVNVYTIDGKYSIPVNSGSGTGIGSSNFPIDAILISKDVPDLGTNTYLKIPAGKIISAGETYEVEERELTNGSGSLRVVVYNTDTKEYESFPYNSSYIPELCLKLFYYQVIGGKGFIWGIADYKVDGRGTGTPDETLEERVASLENKFNADFVSASYITVDTSSGTVSIPAGTIYKDYGEDISVESSSVTIGSNAGTVSVYYRPSDSLFHADNENTASDYVLFHINIGQGKIWGIAADKYQIDGKMAWSDDIKKEFQKIDAKILPSSPILITDIDVLNKKISIPQSIIIGNFGFMKYGVSGELLIDKESSLIAICYDKQNENFIAVPASQSRTSNEVSLFYYDFKSVSGLSVNQYKINGKFVTDKDDSSEITSEEIVSAMESLAIKSPCRLSLSKPVEYLSVGGNLPSGDFGVIKFPSAEIFHNVLGYIQVDETTVDVPLSYGSVFAYDMESKSCIMLAVDAEMANSVIPLFILAFHGSNNESIPPDIFGLSVKDYKIDGKFQIPKNPSESVTDDITKTSLVGYLKSQMIFSSDYGPLFLDIDTTSKTATISSGGVMFGIAGLAASINATTFNYGETDNTLFLGFDISDTSNIHLVSLADYANEQTNDWMFNVVPFCLFGNGSFMDYTNGEILYTIDGVPFGAEEQIGGSITKQLFTQTMGMYSGNKNSFITLDLNRKIEYTQNADSNGGILKIPASTMFTYGNSDYIALNNGNALELNVPVSFIDAVVVNVSTGEVTVRETNMSGDNLVNLAFGETVAFYLFPTFKDKPFVGLDPSQYTIDGKSVVGGSGGGSGLPSQDELSGLVQRNFIQSNSSSIPGALIVTINTSTKEISVEGILLISGIGNIDISTSENISYASYTDTAVLVYNIGSSTVELADLDSSNAINTIVIGFLNINSGSTSFTEIIPNTFVVIDEREFGNGGGSLIGMLYNTLFEFYGQLESALKTYLYIPDGLIQIDTTTNKITMPSGKIICIGNSETAATINEQVLNIMNTPRKTIVCFVNYGDHWGFQESTENNIVSSLKFIFSYDKTSKKVFGLSPTDYTIDGESLIPTVS